MRTLGLILTLACAGWCHGPLPVAFEPNWGQEAAGKADFVAHGPGYRVALSAGQAELSSGESRITAVLAGSRGRPRGEAEDRLPGVVNYLPGWDVSRAISGIPTYGRVRYRSVYPGIDVVYYGKDGRLEFDFLVAPGADPRRIRMRYEGARSVRVDAAGDLVLETADGTFRQHRPEMYQETGGGRRAVAGRYALRGGTVRFEVAKYDRRHALVIDPALTWATYYFSSSLADTAEAVAVDSSGNIYIVGSMLLTGGLHGAYAAELSPDGTKALFTTYLGGGQSQVTGNYLDELAHAITVDSSGNSWITGEATTTGYDYYYGTYSYTDAFLSKLDPNGHPLGSMALNGSNSQIGYAIALDASGNIYVAGATNSNDFKVSVGQKTCSATGTWDGFVARFNSVGQQQYGACLTGSGNDYAFGVAVGANGNVYVTGSTDSPDFPVTSPAYQANYGGGTDAFVAKLSPTFSFIYSTYLGGSGSDSGNAIAVNSNGEAYVTGQTTSSDFPLANASQKTLKGPSDIFVTKMSADGTALAFSTLTGGSGDDAAYAIALDPADNAFLTGTTTSTDFPVLDAFQKTNAGTQNAVVAALTASGAPLFASYLGGNGSGAAVGTGMAPGDTGNGIAFGCAAGLAVAGTTTSPNFPVTSGTVATTFGGGGSDGFVAKIASGGTPAIADGGAVNGASFGAGPVAPGSALSVFGSGLAAGPQAASALPLPNALAGTTVSINGTAAPLYYSSAGQVNVQVPYEIAPGPATVTVTNGCGTSNSTTIQVAQAAPYLFQTGSGDAIAYNQDNTLNGPDNPAPKGSIVTVYLTGVGPVSNPVATGAGASTTQLSEATLSKSATIGGADSSIYFLGLTPSTAGVAQANLVVPALSAGAQPVVVTVAGAASNAANVYVK